jgi:DNA polymerase-4
VSDAPVRKIIHVDMDAFYASVEQRDNPDLRGKPVAVGGARERGVVAAASYEARKFGVYSAMPSVTARRKCPDLVFVKPRFEVYREVSQQIREIFRSYTPLVEPLSLDEAYLDVTENLMGIPSATEVAKEIKARIKEQTQLTASAGVSYCKFLAKMASGERKPDGLFVITPAKGAAYVEALPVGKFHGIGPATEAKMHRLGIRTGADMKEKGLEFLKANFGKSGPYYFNLSHGIDQRQVRPHRIRKSAGAENTFFENVKTFEEARDRLLPIIAKLWRYCEQSGVRGRTVTLKVKYADFEIITRRRTETVLIETQALLEQLSLSLLGTVFPIPKEIRLLGISLSSLNEDRDEEEEEEGEAGDEEQLRLVL